MSMNDTRQGGKDAADNEQPRNTANEHWRTQQDYNTAFAAQKKKQG